MPGIARVRSRSPGNPGNFSGYSVIGSGVPTFSAAALPTETCSDVVGNPTGDNFLSLSRFTHEPVFFNGTNNLIGTNSYRKFSNFPANWSTAKLGHLSQSTPFLDATQAIAAGHPGEPGLSIPNFLYELKDIPGMLKQLADRARDLHRIWTIRGWRVSHRALASYYGSRHGQKVGEDYLAYHFGWAPFFSDLADTLQLSKFLEHRRKKFQSMKGNQLRTSGRLGSSDVFGTQKYTLATGLGSPSSVFGIENQHSHFEQWFSAKWDVDPIRFGATLASGSRRQLMDFLGFDNSLPVYIWDALPWSWLSDWFLNVGNIISLMGNRQGCKFHGAMIMTLRETERKMTVSSAPPNWLSVSNGQMRVVDKNRQAFAPTFLRTDAGFNIFQPSHLATLASLKVTKFAGSSHF
jgi:hypothetical protein